MAPHEHGSGVDHAAAGRHDLTKWRTAAAANAFDTDPFFQRLVARLLGDADADAVARRLHRLADQLGPALDADVRECSRDENLPRLRRHDELGHPIESVTFHPAHHRVGRVFWGSGVLSELERPGTERLAGSMGYLLSQHGEAGHTCPIACTAGAIKLVQRVGTDAQRERWLPGLLDRDYDHRLHAAQFVTEVQGGSDVGLNTCVARPDPDRADRYRLSGEKWFCSVADAGLFVVSARIEGGAEGTRGLGLFLVPRCIDDRPNGFVLRRLKYKLGTRSMPTGEIEFQDALAEPIGPIGDGFRNLVSIVLDTSRVHNAVAACGVMRRAFQDAHTYAAHRRAFGVAIAQFPSTQEILARMKVSIQANLTSTFWILSLTDALAGDGSDPDREAARRVAVMINKYRTAIACTRTVRDGIEIFGGNGTIEDFSVLPRLYRDAIVLESWEGTHNTLCAQILRDMATRKLHEPWLRVMGREIEGLDHPALADDHATAQRLHAELAGAIETLLASDPSRAAAQIRTVVDRMGTLTDLVSLAAHARWELADGDGAASLDALALYRKLWLERADPLSDPGLLELHQRLAREA